MKIGVWVILACVGCVGDTVVPGSDASVEAAANDVAQPVLDAASDADAATTCDAGPSDPKNCGACGHDCLGGACSSGVCQPVTLATGESMATFVAVDPGATGYAYWTRFQSSGAVRRAPKDLSSAPQTIATASNPAGITLTTNPSLVYWATYGDGTSAYPVTFSNPDGSNATTLSVAYPGSWWVASDGSSTLYMISRVGSTLVAKTTKGSNTGSPLVTLSTSNPGGVYATTDSSHLFVGNVTGGIRRYALDGTNGLTIVPDSFIFTLDGSDVLFSKGDTVYRVGNDGTCTTTTCPAPIVQTQGTTAGSIAVDAKYIYWIATSTGTSVWRANKDGTNAVRLYEGANDSAPGNLVADDTAIYWAVQTPGTVYRLAK